jgi:type 1 glutamine amidotransferase
MHTVKTKSPLQKAKVVIALSSAALISGACGADAPRSARQDAAATPAPYRVLVFTRTAGYRHESIPAGAAAIRRLGRRNGFSVTTTADPARFTRAGLRRFKAVVFLSTTGTPVKAASQRRAFAAYIRAGGGFVGVHAAADTRGAWPFYDRLVGARFDRHDPGTPTRTIQVVDRGSAATRDLPAAWTRADEWYEFRSRPRAHVLARLDAARPLAWCHDYDGGRSVYTALGHTTAAYAEPAFLGHLLGAIEMAAGQEAFDCAA